jgi:hypothetical protein
LGDMEGFHVSQFHTSQHTVRHTTIEAVFCDWLVSFAQNAHAHRQDADD